MSLFRIITTIITSTYKLSNPDFITSTIYFLLQSQRFYELFIVDPTYFPVRQVLTEFLYFIFSDLLFQFT